MNKLYFFISMFCTYFCYSQVTIGAAIPSTEGALLDIKEFKTTGTDLSNANKGIMYPRVALVNNSDLAPLILNANEEQKKQATGMMVFNTTTDSSKGLAMGVYIWNGNQWVIGIGTVGNAEISDISSEDITVNGKYFKGEVLKPENSISINFIVTSPGKYEVSATTDNGYYFMASGEFLAAGKNVITITGSGIPMKSTDELGAPDKIKVRVNSSSEIIKNNTVEGIPAAFTMNCSSISSFGIFKPSELLTSSEYLAVQLAANPSAVGAKYNIKSNEVNGYSFSAEGTISGTKQTIYLYPEIGTQKPLEAGTDYFTLTSNSSISTSTCNATVPVVGPTLSVISYGNWFTPATVLQPLAEDDKAFSPTGIYKIQNINFSNGGTTGAEINGSSDIDGAFVSYGYAINNGTKVSNAVAYIQAGKALLYASDYNSNITSLVAQVFGVPESEVKINTGTSGEEGKFVNSDNPILKGPFGNISGGGIPADAGGNFSVKINHPDFVPIANTSEGYSRVFMHKTKGLIIIGDGGPYGTNMGWKNKNMFLKNVMAWMADIKGKNN